ETNIGYLNLFEHLFKKYGAPLIVLADRRRTFYSPNNTITPVARALSERYHIEIQTSSSPTFKPNIERLWNTLQHWLPPFLVKHNIKNIEQFNQNIDFIIDAYDKKYYKQSDGRNVTSLFSEVPLELQKIFVEIPRKFFAGTVQYQNDFYVPITENNKRYYVSSDEASIKFGYDSKNELVFYIDGKYYKSQILRNDELTEYQQFVIRNYLDVHDEYTKKFYRAVKKSKEFANNLYEVVTKIKSKYDLTEEIKDYFKVSKEILESLSEIYKEIIEKEHIAP
ncbi:transposase family protein, partial [Mycoplasma sp. VS30B]